VEPAAGVQLAELFQMTGGVPVPFHVPFCA